MTRCPVCGAPVDPTPQCRYCRTSRVATAPHPATVVPLIIQGSTAMLRDARYVSGGICAPVEVVYPTSPTRVC